MPSRMADGERPSSDSGMPMIEVLPMLQGPDIRHEGEDWTGYTSAALRKKLQNRLNQRAARRRRSRNGATQSLASESVLRKAQDALGPAASKLNQNLHIVEDHPATVSTTTISLGGLIESECPPKSNRTCVDLYGRRSVVSSPNFLAFLATSHIYPLSADHALITLLHFNLIRALTQNIISLGLNPDHMSLDIPSPWDSSAQCATSTSSLPNIPPALHPSPIQLSIPHHPEIDVLPFKKYRDNLVLAGDEVDDVELCQDMLYGVDPNRSWDLSTCKQAGLGGRTGFIVWCDPWLQESWEVDEEFLKKWKRLFVGCEEILERTNYWREKRGEPKLVIEL